MSVLIAVVDFDALERLFFSPNCFQYYKQNPFQSVVSIGTTARSEFIMDKVNLAAIGTSLGFALATIYEALTYYS